MVDVVDDWEVRNNIVAMCFDTTSSNTGAEEGACTYLNKAYNGRILHFACRHHQNELPAKRVFHVALEENKK